MKTYQNAAQYILLSDVCVCVCVVAKSSVNIKLTHTYVHMHRAKVCEWAHAIPQHTTHTHCCTEETIKYLLHTYPAVLFIYHNFCDIFTFFFKPIRTKKKKQEIKFYNKSALIERKYFSLRVCVYETRRVYLYVYIYIQNYTIYPACVSTERRCHFYGGLWLFL